MPPRRCGACSAPLLQLSSTGRPRQYCGPTCRQRAHRQRELTRVQTVASRDDWWTPDETRETIRNRWNITLDAAATNDSCIVPNYFGPDHPDPVRRDATVLNWSEYADGGHVYINPPYSTALLRKFLAKAVETSRRGTPVTALLPAATSTHWWATQVMGPAAHVEFITGRLRFGGPHAAGGPAPFASALVTWPGLQTAP